MKQLRTFALAAALALAAGCSGVSDEEWCAENYYYVNQLLMEVCVASYSKREWCARCARCALCCDRYHPEIRNPADCHWVDR